MSNMLESWIFVHFVHWSSNPSRFLKTFQDFFKISGASSRISRISARIFKIEMDRTSRWIEHVSWSFRIWRFFYFKNVISANFENYITKNPGWKQILGHFVTNVTGSMSPILTKCLISVYLTLFGTIFLISVM